MVFVGRSAKNAIPIVEFARELEMQRRTIVQATAEASRLRPIMMTSIAFIMGVASPVTSTGAGSEMRCAMCIAVFFGMLGVTFFGPLLTPVFYVLLRKPAVGRPLKDKHADHSRRRDSDEHRPVGSPVTATTPSREPAMPETASHD